jgi:hypothetical protein
MVCTVYASLNTLAHSETLVLQSLDSAVLETGILTEGWEYGWLRWCCRKPRCCATSPAFVIFFGAFGRSYKFFWSFNSTMLGKRLVADSMVA